MTTIYDKTGKVSVIPHQVDVREALRTGKYFLEDPTKKKLIKKKEQKVKEVVDEVIEVTDEKESVEALFGETIEKEDKNKRS